MRPRKLTIVGAITVLGAAAVAASVSAVGRVQPPPSFKVAFFNIRAGKGQPALRGRATPFTSSGNCTDTAKPLNAWGTGLVQKHLLDSVGKEPVIALGLAESWASVCGSPEHVGRHSDGRPVRASATASRWSPGTGSRVRNSGNSSTPRSTPIQRTRCGCCVCRSVSTGVARRTSICSSATGLVPARTRTRATTARPRGRSPSWRKQLEAGRTCWSGISMSGKAPSRSRSAAKQHWVGAAPRCRGR